jgi:superfamily II DNA or RNA helicase
MVNEVTIQKKNHVSLQLDCDRGIAQELDEFFSFFVQGYKFMPLYKNKVWDGKVRLFNRNTYELPVGLYDHLVEYCKKYDYKIDLEEGPVGLPGEKNDVTMDEIYQFIQSLNLHARGEPIQVRDYQFSAIFRSIRDKRLTLISPTASGKSLIIYCVIRWYLENNDDKVLIVVPTTALVEQMATDFGDYSSHDPSFNIDKWAHRIMSGVDKDTTKRLVISTWQSIYKLQQSWFAPFGAVMGDECHGFQSKSLTGIMNKCRSASFRIGTTGTLDGTQVHQLTLEGIFGRVYKVTTTKKLQDAGSIAGLNISVISLRHPEDVCQDFGKREYHDEINYIVTNEARNKFIMKMALTQKGNTLILFNYVDKHGKVLYDMIRQAADPARKIFYVSGETSTSDREVIRGIIESQKNSITTASLGTFSTGTNIRNLHNIIVASPSKSQIRVLQSIGRGLRKSDDGSVTQLIDIVDDISHGNRKNHALRHGAQRLEMYDEQEFNYKIYNIKLGT